MVVSNNNIKQNILSLRPSATLAINELSNELINQGKEVYKLGFGQSPFPVPAEVVQALKDHAHEKDYLPVKGLYALRETVAAYYLKRYKIKCTAENVLIGPGSKELLFIVQNCYDADLILPSPSWVSYSPQAHIINKRTHWIDTSDTPKKLISALALENFCAAHPYQKFILILNYPCNPTGATYDSKELEDIAEVSRKYDLIIISDEIYGELTYQSDHVSLANFYPEGTIISSGLSKWCGAGGWRLGTFLIPSNLNWLTNAMAVVASETFTATSAPIQYAAIKAFEFSSTIENYVKKSRAILQAIGQYTFTELRSIGLQMPEPKGGFYLFPNFELFRVKLNQKEINNSVDLCKTLLDETGVALLPGADFGQQLEELSTRLSYVDFDGKKALSYLDDDDNILDNNFMNEYAPRIVAACNAIKNWLL